MQIFNSPSEIPTGFGPSAVAVGKFDGVHRGHQEMISQLLVDAGSKDLIPTVLTFDRNPLSVLAPDRCPPSLISNQQKLELLEERGVQAALMLTFDREQSQQSAEDFVELIVFRGLGARVVYAGPDFRYGKGGRGDVALLDEMGRNLGFEVRHVPEIDSEGRKISSTWLRELLGLGQVESAAQLLGREHTVRGRFSIDPDTPGQIAGRVLVFSGPTEGLIPAAGEYEGSIEFGGVIESGRILVSEDSQLEFSASESSEFQFPNEGGPIEAAASISFSSRLSV
ncbi:MAG: bifunctional riboflavin kinase/FAD synthetase [Microbacteriaceae bacterium]|nr:bifunctional riboflavin kinase/FAD synthetase [Microbacteriaceae bacterium]